MGTSNTGDEPPPPYSMHGDESNNFNYSSSRIFHLHQQFTHLPERMRLTSEGRSIQQSIGDDALLKQIVPEITTFLSVLENIHRHTMGAYLYLVPDIAAIPPNAVLSGVDEMRQRGEYCRTTRVDVSPITGEQKKRSKPTGEFIADMGHWNDRSTGYEFSDRSRCGDLFQSTETSSPQKSTLWWRDEKMAQRLASRLRPRAAVNNVGTSTFEETPTQAVLEHRLSLHREKRGWFTGWGNGACSSNMTSFATTSVEMSVENFAGQNGGETTTNRARSRRRRGPKLSIKAEWVAFRIENDFGIMESIFGWAIVVTVRL